MDVSTIVWLCGRHVWTSPDCPLVRTQDVESIVEFRFARVIPNCERKNQFLAHFRDSIPKNNIQFAPDVILGGCYQKRIPLLDQDLRINKPHRLQLLDFSFKM